jgi:hypothetical protein
MPLSELLKDLHIDPELVDRDREMCAGMAKAHERYAREAPESDEERRFLHFMAAATEYRRAAAHSVLLSDRDTSIEMFRRAGMAYARVGRPYALMMFWCSDDVHSVLDYARKLGWAKRTEPTQLAYMLLSYAAGLDAQNHESFETLSAALTTSRNSPIGVLGISIGSYVDLARALMVNEPMFPRVTEMLMPFLVPYSSALRRCMEDEYHWQRMAFPFHPAEPDTLSVLFCVEATLRWRQQPSLLAKLEGMPLGAVATKLLYAAVRERFEGGQHELRRE